MSKKELAKRYTLFIISLFFSGLGVAITKHGELGVSPISSVANVMNYKIPALSMGTWLLIWNCVLLLGQIIILRRDFKPIQLLQIPLSVLFGWFTDLGLKLASYIPNDIYVVKLILVVTGIIILAFGVSLAVIANVIMNSGEAFVKAISDKTGWSFGNVKIAFDISCVTLAIVLSLSFFNFRLVGTREGTFIAAVLTGTCVKIYLKTIRSSVEEILK